ncbi:MAG: SAM-dependent methyltransferase, partial [Candidatus Nanopelagicales bacterium]
HRGHADEERRRAAARALVEAGADLDALSSTLATPIGLAARAAPLDEAPAWAALMAGAAPDADLVPMVKPQFEVGREAVGAGGVVRDPEQRAEAVRRIADTAHGLGWGMRDVAASPLPGPSGNVEFFLWLRRDAGAPEHGRIAQIVEAGHDG